MAMSSPLLASEIARTKDEDHVGERVSTVSALTEAQIGDGDNPVLRYVPGPDDGRPRGDSIRVFSPRPNSRCIPYRRSPLTAHESINLTFGYLAYVYIDVPGGTPMLLSETKSAIRALRFLSPVINVAVHRNGWYVDLNHIALPPGNKQAYLDILMWLDKVLLKGGPLPLTSTNPNLLLSLGNVLEIAETLRIEPLIGDMNMQLDAILRYTIRECHFVPVNDIDEVYGSGKYSSSHPLRKKMAKILAQAWLANDLPVTSKRHISKMINKHEELWVEMKASIERPNRKNN